MKFFAIFFLVSTSFSTGFAAPSAVKKKTHESAKAKTQRVVVPEKYAALEDTQAIAAPIAPTTITDAPAKAAAPKVTQQKATTPLTPEKLARKSIPTKSPVAKAELEIAPAQTTAPASPALSAAETLSGDLSENSDPHESFDAVPSDQIPLVIKRLKLIELLISRHARAYDYRSLTLKELEGRLALLESKNARKNQITTGASAIDEISRVRETEPLPLPPSEAEDLEDDVENDENLNVTEVDRL